MDSRLAGREISVAGVRLGWVLRSHGGVGMERGPDILRLNGIGRLSLCVCGLGGSGLAGKGISVAEVKADGPLLGCMACERSVFVLRRTVPLVVPGAVKGFCIFAVFSLVAVSGDTSIRRPR